MSLPFSTRCAIRESGMRGDNRHHSKGLRTLLTSEVTLVPRLLQDGTNSLEEKMDRVEQDL